MSLLLIFGVLLLPAAQAEADALCADVQRLAKGAGETPAFDSLMREGFAPRLPLHCRPNGRSYFCHGNLLPRETSHAALGLGIARCLRGASLTVENPGGPGVTRVRSGALEIDLEETGTDRAHVGRMLDVEIRAAH